MKILIADQETPINQVSYNDGLNFGRFEFEGIKVLRYEIFIDKNEFISLMKATYDQCLEEIKLDDETHYESSVFKEMGYADIDGAFNYPDVFSEAIETFLAREFFAKVIVNDGTNKFIINSTDRVNVNDEKILIFGRCFSRKQHF